MGRDFYCRRAPLAFRRLVGPTRVGLCLLVVLVGIFQLGCGREVPPPERPNIVFVIGDDHGYPDFGFMGSDVVRTPNLDRLALEGTVFTHGFVSASICDPSLRSLVTGLHPMQWQLRKERLRSMGVDRGLETEIVDFVTLPKLLARADYRSFQAGKLFGGSYDVAGFDAGMNGPGVDLRFGGPGRKQLGRETMAPVLEFLDEQGETPFFLWFAPMLPHRPFDASPELQALYAGKGLSRAAVRYYANISRFDELVGELVEALEKRGLRERTLIVYLADNGWDQGSHDVVQPGWDADGERGKRSMYELGFRTPILFNWPGHVEAGVVRDEFVSSVDLFPTLLHYAGVMPSPGRPGFSLYGLLHGSKVWSRQSVYASMSDVRDSGLRPAGLEDKAYEPASMLRNEDWYYIDYEAWGIQQLFDVRGDPTQDRNVLEQHPEVAAQLRREIADWKRAMESGYMGPMMEPPSAMPFRPTPVNDGEGSPAQGPTS
jgi:arylsulfatase A-like enzyme